MRTISKVWPNFKIGPVSTMPVGSIILALDRKEPRGPLVLIQHEGSPFTIDLKSKDFAMEALLSNDLVALMGSHSTFCPRVETAKTVRSTLNDAEPGDLISDGEGLALCCLRSAHYQYIVNLETGQTRSQAQPASTPGLKFPNWTLFVGAEGGPLAMTAVATR